MLDRFETRYAGFRAGLPRGEQRLFDRMVTEGHRHTNSLNSHPELDFERPLFLAFLLATVERLEVEQARLERRLAEVAGEIPPRRLPAPHAQQLGGLEQARLSDAADGSLVPA
jgi:hypothetical protein